MAQTCVTEDGYQRIRRKHVYFMLMGGVLVYICVIIMILHHNVSTEQLIRAFQIVDFKPELQTTKNSPRFQMELNSSKEHVVMILDGNKSTSTSSSFKEGGLLHESIAISSGSYKQRVNSAALMKFQSTSTIWSGKIRKWDKTHPLVFMHIGKCGGQSFDLAMSELCKRIKAQYIGFRHFDWSYIDTIQKPDVLVQLREPVSRAASHFYFATKKRILKTNGNITDFLRSPQNMLEARDIWQDGQAAVYWLTGTHIANWVGIDFDQIEAREIQSLDHIKMCKLAADRLKQTLWFGFLNDQKRSLEMLQWQLGYDKPIKLPLRNTTPHPNLTLGDSEILKSLMPMDMWLYNYAGLLFEARWQQYKTGIYREPELPPFPEMNCKSTRHILACNKKAPLGPLYHIWDITKEITRQTKILPKDGWI